MNIRINKSILAAILGITACSKDAARIPEGSNIEIRAEVSYEALEGSSAVPKALNWEYGDEISLLHHNGNHILSCISSGEKAHFKGTAPKLPDGGNYLAVFPYRLDYILQEETSSPGQKYSFKVEMPSVLPLTPDSVNPCIGSGFLQNGEINIKHSTGYLCYTISRNDIKYISISSDDGLALGICNGFQALIKLGLCRGGGQRGESHLYRTSRRHHPGAAFQLRLHRRDLSHHAPSG